MLPTTLLRKPIWSTMVLCFLICILALACTQPSPAASPAIPTPQQTGPRYGGIFRQAGTMDGVSIGYPPKLVRTFSMYMVDPVIETLLRIDKTGKPIPWLAADYKENASTKSLTLTLNKGIKFHDGTDFNADAVKWNLDQQKSAKSPGSERVSSIDVIDDSTVRIVLTDWDSGLTTNLSHTLGMIISPTAYKKNGEDWAANNPVGTGPFTFISWAKDAKATFKKFDGYWIKGKPYLDGMEWTPVTNTVTRQMSFLAKDFDLAHTMSAKDIPDLEKAGYLMKRGTPGPGVWGLVPDSKNPNSPFSKLQVRQATQYAVDTAALVKAIFLNEAEPANQWSDKSHWAYNSSVVGYPYNPTKAKQLLAEAGYPNGFQTTILYLNSPENEQIYTAVQGYLKAVGIDAKLDPMLSARFDQLAFRGGTWEGLMWGPGSSTPDFVAALARYYSGQGGYYTQMLIPDDYVTPIKNAISAPDFETKQKLIRDAMKLMVDKYCLQLFLYAPLNNAVTQPYVRGTGYFETINAAIWTPEDTWLDKK